jgi:hypothetical protein
MSSQASEKIDPGTNKCCSTLETDEAVQAEVEYAWHDSRKTRVLGTFDVVVRRRSEVGINSEESR